MGDSRRFRQVIRNLVSNAIKYGGEQIQITASGSGDRRQIIVRDNGRGVTPGDEARIFEAYEHAASVPGMPTSMGLGLPVSRRLTEAMGGTLVYRRSAQGWTEFVCDVPAAATR
jgi:signal transduction histidine kinase